MKTKVIAGEYLHECEECGEEVDRCDDCKRDFELGDIVHCYADYHYCDICWNDEEQ